MTKRPQPKRLDVPELLLNKRPLQQSAKRWLKRLKVPANPQRAYLVQLLFEAFESDLSVPGEMDRYRWELQERATRLANPLADQKRVMAYLLSNPDLWSRREQEECLLVWLEEAKNPEDALSRMLEWFAMLKLTNDPEFTLAASEPPTA